MKCLFFGEYECDGGEVRLEFDGELMASLPRRGKPEIPLDRYDATRIVVE